MSKISMDREEVYSGDDSEDPPKKVLKSWSKISGDDS
jgi:hypothetical protein